MSEDTKRASAPVDEDIAPPAQPERQEDESDSDVAQEQYDQTQQIIQTGTVTPTKGKYVIHCLTIVGQVEGHYILPPQNKTTKYEHVIPQLVAIQENPEIEGLIIILNTVGGDVEAGLAIAELISGMKKPTVSLVLGGGHSIGVPLAVSARKSFIVPSATMTIHPVRMNGVVLGVPQTLSYFDKMQERIVRFVEDNSRISQKRFRQLMMNTGELVMDVGTVLDGQQAVKAGLIDYLGGLSDAIRCLYDLIEEEKALAAEELDDEDMEEENDADYRYESRVAQAANSGRGKRSAGHGDRRRRIRARSLPARSGAVAGTARNGVWHPDAPAAPHENETWQPANDPLNRAEPASAENRKARDVFYRHGELHSPGDDDPHSDPVFPRHDRPKEKPVFNAPAEFERGYGSVAADDSDAQRYKRAYDPHKMKQPDRDGGERGDVNPFGHPSPSAD